MRAYVIRRLLLVIPTVLLVSIIVFMLIRLIPGDIIDLIVSEHQGGAMGGTIDRADIARILGMDFDAPLYVQYGQWLGVVPQVDGTFSGIFQGDFGDSFWSRTPVIDDILTRWPVTFELGFLSIIIAQLIALPIGIYSALRQDTWGDYVGRSFAILCIAIPGFWLGTLVIVFPALWWNYMPPIMFTPFLEDPMGNLKMFIVPAIVLGMAMSGMTMRITRTMLLEVLRADYIRTAWAKGLRERIVLIRHALKNALIPVITLVGLQMGVVLGGTVIIEQIFVLPGMSSLAITASTRRDYPVLSAVMLFYGVAMVLINLMVDLTYGFLDPRVHYK